MQGTHHVFFHYTKTGRPLVIMKYAMTLDGKTATFAGHSRWITGERARRRVHEDRSRYSAVMCGVGTMLADDSLLTCRLPDTRNPVRIICDSQLRTPPDSQVAATCSQARTILATCCPDRKAWLPYEGKGCEILLLPPREGRVDLNALTERLGQMGIDSVLLEGGSTLNWSALNQGIVNRVQAYISPGLFGGATAKTPVGGRGVEFPYQGFSLGKTKITVLDQDILIEGVDAMFTGIIEETRNSDVCCSGRFIRFPPGPSKQTESLEDIQGDSIAVNGVCLTAYSFDSGCFYADVMPESTSVPILAVFPWEVLLTWNRP